MNIFVHRASECLTDYLSHGDGLICYSLLSGLVQRGHRIYAYTNHSDISADTPGLIVHRQRHVVPANSLANVEHAWRADRWLGKIARTEKIDLVWRMHPYNQGCPTVPRTDGRPLVVGPMFHSWPVAPTMTSLGRPRFGFGIGSLVAPVAMRGWSRTLKAATLVLCATERLAGEVRAQTRCNVVVLPVIVDPPAELVIQGNSTTHSIHLLFVANLVPNKRADLFCSIVAKLRAASIDATATIIGDGPDRSGLANWCMGNGVSESIIFTGRLPNAEVYRRMAAADLLVSTSFGEPYGRNIVEAMSVGTPAICHRSGGPADIIADGVDGALIDVLDADAYSTRIVKLVQSKRLLELGRAAATKARNWRSDVVIDRLESLLLELIA